MFKRWLSAGLILLAVWFGGSGVTANASNSTYTDALATAPQGIFLKQTDPFLTVTTTDKSSATIVDTSNPETPGTQAAVLTNGTSQFGSFWSTSKGYFDLKQNQTLSAWLYLGDQGAQSGDGMAFVLQNDPHGLAAMPTVGKKKALPGETLGVWAVDNNSQKNQKVFASTAIQDSWALEFDTAFNGLTGRKASGQADSFDATYPAIHIASNYPGDPTTYLQHYTDYGGILSSRDYYYTMVHNGLINNVNEPDFLANGQWHHLTLKWDAAAKQMTYTFDDRDPQTGAQLTGVSRTVPIDLKKIDPDNTGKARWGFTSATGTHNDTNMVVLENVPGLIDTQTRAKLTDIRRRRIIKSGDQVLSNDRLQLKYRLDYRQGRRGQDWNDILAQLKLPKGFVAEHGLLEYQKGQRQNLDDDQLAAGKVALRFDRALTATNNTATIVIDGHAKAVTKTETVPAVTSTFTSPALVSNAEIPDFIINPNADLRLAITSPNPVKLAAHEGTTVTGKVTLNSDADKTTDAKVSAELNGRRLGTQDVASDGTFAIPLTPDQLHPGTNKLRLTASTSLGDAAKPQTVTISVPGELKFAAMSAKESFQDTQLTGSDQLIKRSGKWQLAVQDTRGTGEKWTLTAQASPFIATAGHEMAGQPVYVTKYQTIPITDSPTPVLQHITDDSVNDGLVDVAATWTPDTGILLQVHGGSSVGDYRGTITWALTDAPS